VEVPVAIHETAKIGNVTCLRPSNGQKEFWNNPPKTFGS